MFRGSISKQCAPAHITGANVRVPHTRVCAVRRGSQSSLAPLLGPARRRAKLTKAEANILSLTADLLTCIAVGDYDRYQDLCADDLTCFEPEAGGYLVEGLPFHQWYFDLQQQAPSTDSGVPNQTLSSPKVRMLGNQAAVVTYIRLQQIVDADGRPKTIRSEETRVWRFAKGKWKNVHFHRSSPSVP